MALKIFFKKTDFSHLNYLPFLREWPLVITKLNFLTKNALCEVEIDLGVLGKNMKIYKGLQQLLIREAELSSKVSKLRILRYKC